MMQKLLIVEDDEAIASIERDYLERDGFAVEIVADGPTRTLLADEALMARNRLALPFGVTLAR